MDGLFYYKLVSEYPEDVTKNCKLSISEIDSNFKVLKDNTISGITFVSGDCKTNADNALIVTRKNGEQIVVPMNTELCKNIAYDLNVDVCDGKSGATLSISYKYEDYDSSGETVMQTVRLDNIITADNLEDIIGSDLLTKVITDNTLTGLGTMQSPLGIAGVEKTGMLAPVKGIYDLTEGEALPENPSKGERYITREYVSDFGYLYNGNGVDKIKELLNRENKKTNVSDDRYKWRVPSKEDWDKLLNSVEPCISAQTHSSSDCHSELGLLAGKYLKSKCGWVGQDKCNCLMDAEYNACEFSGLSKPEDDDYVDDDKLNEYPDTKAINTSGIDKYGMKILPSGIATWNKIRNKPDSSKFGENATFWTTTHIYNDSSQDIYLKAFNAEMAGVYQYAECPDPYYSVRLVKDYDGSNYREVEYIDGIAYKTILFPESGQIWLASNFANTQGFDGYVPGSTTSAPDYLAPNNGMGITDRRIEMFINEYNGYYWEKKLLDEGMTVVIQDPCLDKDYSSFVYEWTDSEGEKHDISVEISGKTVTYIWRDSEGVPQVFTIDIEFNDQQNVEYRVYIDDETCEKYLKNVDDLIVERVLNIIIPLIDKERNDREKADDVLSGAIDDLADVVSALTDAVESLSGDVADLREDLEEEIAERISADTELWDALSAETSARTEADEFLQEEIDEEVARAKAAEDEISGLTIVTTEDKNPYTLKASVGKDEYNMVLESKDGNPDHFIKIKFDGNFGEF